MAEGFTVARYEALKSSIASGLLSVQYEDRRETYRSLAEMQQILRLMESELGVVRSRGVRMRAQTDKGLGP
jgi:hypothetical protein